jgi:hypothetical protein
MQGSKEIHQNEPGIFLFASKNINNNYPYDFAG